MASTVEEALQQATLYTDEQRYAIIKLPPSAITVAAGILAEIGEPFGALIADKDEVTLVAPEEALEDFSKRLQGHMVTSTRYRLITFEVVLEFSMVGFMARVATALAQAGVPIFPFSAYSTDHVLVPTEHFEQAIKTLEQLRR